MKTLLPFLIGLTSVLLCYTGLAAAPTISATKSDQLVVDGNNNGKADGGDTLKYTITISNTGDGDATGVVFTDALDPNTTLLHASPLALDDTYTAIGNTLLEVGVTPSGFPALSQPASAGLLANDLTLTDAISLTPFTAATSQGGSVTVGANGTFTYTPPVGFVGTDTFTYTIKNSADATLATTATATINVQNRVWYVNNAGANGDGRSHSPFNNVGAAQTPSSAGDIIFVHQGSGPYTGGITLKNNQQLIGQGVNLVVGGFTLASASGAPTISNSGADTIVLASGNTVKGLTAGGTNGRGIFGDNVGSLTIASVSVSVAGAAGVVIANGALNVTFTSVSAGGGANGIALTNTTGSFTITGTGAANSGGTIQNTTGAGIALSSVTSPSFTSMNIQDTGGSGIKGRGVVNFTFINGTINNSGTALGVDDSNIAFNTIPTGTENNLAGTVTITGSLFSNAYYHGVDIWNYNGTISDLNISNNRFTSDPSTTSSKGTAIRINALGSASTIANITKGTINNNVINNFPTGAGILVHGGNGNASGAAGTYGIAGSATDVITITGNSIAGQSAANRLGTSGIEAAVNGKGQGNFNASNNSITNVAGTAITCSTFGQSTTTATINNNVIVANNTVGSQGIGIGAAQSIAVTDTPDLTATINNNTISQTDGNGILAIVRSSEGTARFKVQNNSVAAPLTGVRQGIRVDSGTSVGNTTLCLNISGNTSAGSGDALGIGLRKQGTSATTNVFGVNGMSATSTPGVESYVNGLNPSGGGTQLLSATSGFSNCSLPLLAGAGGVEPTATASLPVGSDPSGKVASRVLVDNSILDNAKLNLIVAAAKQRWQATGLTGEQLAALDHLGFVVADLTGWQLAAASCDQVQINKNAAGNGWFIDPTPLDDAEFGSAISSTRLYTDPQGPPAGRIDLLTTVLHEMGHALGLSDSYAAQAREEVMYGFLTVGERRVPVFGQATGAVPGPASSTHFLFSPVSLGTLRAGRSLTIIFTVTVNSPLPASVCQISNQATISGSNFADVLTDDPDTMTSNDPTVTPVADATPPTITTCAPAQSAFANASCQASVPNFTGNVVATDNCTPTNALVITQSPAAGTLVGLGQTSVTITVKDASTNASTCTTTFTVTDNTPPSVTCPSPTTGSADATCHAMIPNVLPGVSASDNCTPAGSLTKTQSPSAGTVVGLGSHTITVTVIDGAGNSNQCTTSFSVADTTPPTAVCSNITVALNASGAATITAANVDGGSTDNCGIASRTVSPSSFTCANRGTNSVTLTVTDTSGNSSQCTAIVIVVDNTPPVITCPTNMIVATDPGQCTATVSFAATATDNCPGTAVVCNPPSGSAFPVGVTTVNCTATDAAGNPSSCSFTVTALGRLTVVFQPPLSGDTNVANQFMAGQLLMHRVILLDCQGNDVTTSLASSVSVRLNVTERDSANTSFVVDVPENFSGVGGPGGLMVLNGGTFSYNLQTTGYEPGTVNNTRFFDSRVTVTYNSDPTVTAGEAAAILESH